MITDCDHITGLNARNSPAETLLARMTGSADRSPVSRRHNATRAAMPWPIREINSAASPTASAPVAAENRLVRQAMLPQGMIPCQSQARIVQIGYPGG